MKTRLASVALLASTAMLPCMTNTASAQGNPYPDARPMFAHPAPHAQMGSHKPASQLVQWNGSFTDLTNHKITFVMVGTDPSKAGKTTTVPVVIIPIKMVYGKTNGNTTFDPMKDKGVNGTSTVIDDIIASPLFNSGVNFTQGGTNLGTTQYEDAFQRGNFWNKSVNKKGGTYHVLLGAPTVLTEQTVKVTSAQGSVMTNPFGTNKVGTFGFGAFDGVLQGFIKKFTQINPGVLPLFVTDNVFLTSGGCCIGGYHDSNGSQPGGQSYSYATYVTDEGSFSQDVEALSHELGEWLDDPFIDNHVNCQDNSILEVGDPLEGLPNYGGFPYTLNGGTYNLQSLVFINYFGDKKTIPVNSWYAFQNDMSHTCPGQ